MARGLEKLLTPFKALLNTCGLSQREAADMFEVRLDTVKSWSAGRNNPPEEVVADLSELALRIDAAVDEAFNIIQGQAEQHDLDAGDGEIELGLASDDYEAQSRGWPCVGAQAAVFGRLIALGIDHGFKFKIVPLGSTVATAAAEETHLK